MQSKDPKKRVGEKFAGYTILRLLGSGGMGEVYLAQHPRLPRRDALKVLPLNVSADPEFRQRFLREAELSATLWHPNIVGVHDRGEFEGQLWISMEYVDGTNASNSAISLEIRARANAPGRTGTIRYRSPVLTTSIGRSGARSCGARLKAEAT